MDENENRIGVKMNYFLILFLLILIINVINFNITHLNICFHFSFLSHLPFQGYKKLIWHLPIYLNTS